MIPFLQQVAEVYLKNERESMLDYCFVFPNKRSGVFFEHYLTRFASGRPLILPAISTIGDVASSFVPYTEASRIDQLFTLYNEYRSLSHDVADFDRFLFWGDMILSDFNDVDHYLVDSSRLFVNLKRFREISANYLTQEQREILERYWGEQFDPTSPDQFWNHLHHDSSTPLEERFLKLWEVLDPLYCNFRQALMDKGTATSGMMVRMAAEHIQTCSRDNLPFRRYIFVGFNVLTLAEIRIFSSLMNLGAADFYWDMASPAFRAEGNMAARFMRRNAGCFPSMYELPEPIIPDDVFPRINVIGVPSSIGQTKVAGEQLVRWSGTGDISDEGNAIDTAVVLPDENLFIPMIHAVPEKITALNVTMGFPIRATSFASFISSVVSMHIRSALSMDEWQFFIEDVRVVLSHPIMQSVEGEACNILLRHLAERRYYMVPVSLIAEVAPELTFVFTPVTDPNGRSEVHGYFDRLLRTLIGKLDYEKDRVTIYFARAYLDALFQLKSAVSRHSIIMKDITFIQLLQRTLSTISVNFAGEPLAGLQIMGVLETRALDFSNIIILSMNERIFPRKHYTRSFIPDSLRRSYGMATTDYQESIYAYYFYRLISRARNVTLLYDARNVSGKSSEMSRYISQLLYLFPKCSVDHTLRGFTFIPPTEGKIIIEKTPEILDRLAEFTRPGGRTLSASSINCYINCSLSFYLKHLCRLDLDEEVTDYMDSGTYGSILHEVAEKIYKNIRGKNRQVTVTPGIIDSIISSTVEIDRLITTTVNEKFNRRDKDDLTPLTGEAKVLGHVIRHFIILMLKEEKSIAPFDFIDAELSIEQRMRISENLSINIRQIIDRVDRIYPEGHYGDPASGYIRIVDYKTGADSVSLTSVEQMFDNTIPDRRKAIMQLMFYCNAYASETGYSGPIQPVIYLLRTISTRGLQPLSYNRKPLTDYREINDEYLEQFRQVITEMFDPSKPFTQATDEHSCKFCSFKAICRRNS